MVREVILLGNPVLRQPSSLVTDVGCADAGRVIADLHDTLVDLRRRYGFGRGLAAPQIGVNLRIVSLIWPEDMTLINPRIIGHSGEQLVWDDCFSTPGLVMKVTRPKGVTVAYLDEHGLHQELRAADSAAELLQHELDHLDGVLAIDRVQHMTNIMMRTEWERQGRPND